MKTDLSTDSHVVRLTVEHEATARQVTFQVLDGQVYLELDGVTHHIADLTQDSYSDELAQQANDLLSSVDAYDREPDEGG